MCLSLSTRAKSDARNSVTSHNRNTVGREGPFISQRTGFSHLLCFSVSMTSFTIKVLIRILQSLSYLVVLRNSPGREVALDLDICILYRTDGRNCTWKRLHHRHISERSEEHGSHPGSFPMFLLNVIRRSRDTAQESATAQRLGEV